MSIMMSDLEWETFWDEVDADRQRVEECRFTCAKFAPKRRVYIRYGANCNECKNCLNKLSLGGNGKRKKACTQRKVLIEEPSNEKVEKKEVDTEPAVEQQAE